MKGKTKVSSLDDLVALFGIIKRYDWAESLNIEYKIWEESRGISQNALSYVWYREATKQREDMFMWEVIGECKLDFAVPILLAECKYEEQYDLCLKPYDREQQIAILGKGFTKSTSLFTKKQFTEYLSNVQTYFGKNGIQLLAQGEYEDFMMKEYS